MRLISGLMMLLLAACAGEAQSSVSGEASQSAEPSDPLAARPLGSVEGAPLGYLEYLPPGYGDGEPRPLLVFLHGSDENGDGSEGQLDRVLKLGIPPLIQAGDWPDERPFVVLSPQYAPERAEACDVADDLAAFIEFATEHYEVDAARVYLTGISCGAFGVWDYLATHGGDDAVAAAVPISGGAAFAIEKAGCALGAVPVWAFHGAQDDILGPEYTRDPMDQLLACEENAGAELELTVYPDAGHDAWIATYDGSAGHDIYAWMLEHTGGG
jgi:predicted peptidase